MQIDVMIIAFFFMVLSLILILPLNYSVDLSLLHASSLSPLWGLVLYYVNEHFIYTRIY